MIGMMVFFYIVLVINSQRRSLRAQEEKFRAVEEREAKYRDLFDNVTDAVYLHSLDGIILDVNASGNAAAGANGRSLIGQSLYTLFGERYRSRIDRYLASLQKTGAGNGVFHIRRPDGQVLYFEYRNSLVARPDMPLAVRGIARNMTETRHAAKALLESEKRFRHLVKYSPLPMMILVDRRIIYANDAAITLLQARDHDEVLGKEIDFFMAYDIMSPELALEQMAVEGRTPRILIERLRLLTGEVRDVETASLPMLFERTRAIHLVIRDITDAKRVETTLREMPQQIIRAQEAERRRVARDLHDGVNQILASIKFRLQLSAGHGEQRNTEQPLDQILVDLEKAIDEVKRISHNLRPSILDDLGLTAAVRGMTDDFTRRTGITAKCVCENLSDTLSSDIEVGLFRIIQEALNNAGKHSGASAVLIRITRGTDTVVAEVVDNGKGFSPAKPGESDDGVPHIGLKTMAERAAALGGTLTVQPAKEGGTSVLVSVPVDRS